MGKGLDGGEGSWGLANAGWGDDYSAESDGEAAWVGGGCSDYSEVEDGDPDGEFEWMQAGDGDF